MTDEDKARAWLREYRHDTCDGNHRDDLPALAALLREVRDEERERCAVVCDEEAKQWEPDQWALPSSEYGLRASRYCAAAIRQMKGGE